MKYLLPLFLLGSGATLPCYAQQAPATSTPQPLYGAARIYLYGAYCQLSLSDGVTPAREYDYVQENGRARRFADEAAVLNYLSSLGWDVLPHAVEDNKHYYLLKRRTP